MTPSPTPSLAGAAGEPSLHQQIMKVPCRVPYPLMEEPEEARAYRRGHCDALHAAAGLARAAIPALPPDTGKQALSGETEAQREEVCAAWADLPDDIRKDARLTRLYRALGGPRMDDRATSQPAPTPDAAPTADDVMALAMTCSGELHYGELSMSKVQLYAFARRLLAKYAASMQDTSSPQSPQGGA